LYEEGRNISGVEEARALAMEAGLATPDRQAEKAAEALVLQEDSRAKQVGGVWYYCN